MIYARVQPLTALSLVLEISKAHRLGCWSLKTCFITQSCFRNLQRNVLVGRHTNKNLTQYRRHSPRRRPVGVEQSLVVFLDAFLAAPVVINRSGREGPQDRSKKPRHATDAVARRDAADEPRPAGSSVQAVVPV